MDLSVDKQDGLQPPASPASSVDSDAYNSTAAQIFFGPLRSPEKRFAAPTASLDLLQPGSSGSPLRRSPRLSSPRLSSPRLSTPVLEPQEEEEEEEEEEIGQQDVYAKLSEGQRLEEEEEEEEETPGQSRPETPEQDRFIDNEPSSILASRIMRAHDNPSPPPQSPPNKGTSSFSLIDISAPPSPFPLPLTLVNGDSVPSPSPVVSPLAFDARSCSPLAALDASPSPLPHHHAAPDPQTDLMSFESAPAPPSHSHVDIASIPALSLPDPSPVDELLFHSPIARPFLSVAALDTGSSSILPSPTLGSPMDVFVESPCTRQEHAEDAPRIGDGEDKADASSILMSSENKGKGLPSSLFLSAEEQPPAQSPVRRSSRSPSRNFSAPKTSQAGPSTSTQLQAPTSPQNSPRKKKRIAKEVDGVGYNDANGSQSSLESETELTERLAKGALKGKGREVDEERATPKRRLGSTLGTPHRVLGSLSPSSTELLTQLLPFPASQLGNIAESSTEAVPATPVRYTSLASRNTPAPLTAPTPPIRFPSPIRPIRPTSPEKFRLKPLPTNDPNRTPARRIPIEQAVAQGQISPHKAAQLQPSSNAAGGSSRAPIFNIPSMDSPARRVVVSQAATPSQVKWQGLRLGTPTKSGALDRSRSVEPPQKPLSATKGRIRSGSVDPQSTTSKDFSFPKGRNVSVSISSSHAFTPAKLPFALTERSAGLPPPIPEEQEQEEPALPDPAIDGMQKTVRVTRERTSPRSPARKVTSPVKSSLKQTTSRIPRIGVKPYARPAPSTTSKNLQGKESNQTTTMRRMDFSKVTETKPFKSVRASTPKSVGSGVSHSSGPIAGPSSVSRGKSASAVDTANAGLKRKREPEKSLSSPVKARGTLRPVLPAVRYTSKASSMSQVDRSPQKVEAPRKFRMVVDKDKPDTARPESPAESSEAPQSSPPEASTNATHLHSPVSPGSSPAPNPSPELTDPAEESLSVRRTTRTRKPVQTFASDVFPARSADLRPHPQPQLPQPQPRRKAPVAFQDSGPFSNMSAVALRALTTSNTVKNQRYLAALLRTEVIRKEGVRPESPVMKVKTIAQRQKADVGKQRKERAERRAKSKANGSREQSDTEGQSDVGYSSMVEMDDSNDEDELESSPIRHRRGPGDEEDYVTPKRPSKRLRVEGEGRENDAEKKRVQWDRGLSTAVFLDELVPRANARPTADIIKKGCLTPAAKALRLNTLGNLDNESPLKNLIQENIVVKKFVYDTDTEPELPPVVVVKNTRSKAKKGKS